MRLCASCRTGVVTAPTGTLCKPCNRERARLFRAANPGKAAEYARRNRERYPERFQQAQQEWRSRNKASETARKLAWRKQNPQMWRFLSKATAAVRSAIKRGELVKPTACEQCARSDRRITAAHLDYLPPYLNVRWLCYSCHTTMDRWAA